MSTVTQALTVFRHEGLAGVARRLNLRGAWSRARLQRLLQRPAVTSAYGIRVAANWEDMTFHFYIRGGYGFFLSDLLRDQSRPFHFMDIGANQGLYSILAARNPLCRGVLALEPVPSTARLLRRNLGLNHVSDRVQVIEAALSDRPGQTAIALNAAHTGGASLRDAPPDGRAAQVQIDVIDHAGLQAWTPEPGLPILVKIDVEGHEDKVISELLHAPFAPAVDTVFYECDEDWVDPGAIKAMLRAAGFRRFEKIGSGRHYDVLACR